MRGTPRRCPAASIALLLLAGSSLAGCLQPGGGSAQASADEICASDGWTEVQAADGDYRFCHPEDWKRFEDTDGAEIDVMVYPNDTQVTATSGPAVTVSTHSVPEDQTPETYAERNVMPPVLDHPKVEVEEARRLDDPRAIQLAYTAPRGDEDGYHRQRILLEPDEVHVLYYVGPLDAAVPSQTLDGLTASFTPAG